VIKMMVLGSSNEISTCWRAFLWQKLRAAGVTNFDFVGSKVDGPDCGVPGYDKDDESRSGTIVTDITAAEYNSRFKAHPPDIVLVHFGGADILQGIAPSRVIPGYTLMVEQGRLVNPQIRFLVAQHTPMNPASCARCPVTVPELNAAIVEWAKQITTAASPVSSVDLFTGLDTATDTSDRVHLNNAGSQKVSDRWLAALLPILKP
jgi:lysophospholipase L1-like esterase